MRFLVPGTVPSPAPKKRACRLPLSRQERFAESVGRK